MPKITPFLWFDTQAEEAAKYYTSIFKNSKITATSYYDEASAKASGQPPGSALVVSFELDSQSFAALNGGPAFKFSEAVSFQVDCESQEEVDYFWDKLTADGGEPSQCGWLKDKFGLSWQIVPAALPKLIGGPDREKSSRAMAALMKMSKIVIADLENA